MKRYKFTATIGDEIIFPKGFYYQGKFVVLVGCELSGHTIRRKVKFDDVVIKVE